MSFAVSASNLAFSLAASSDNTAEPDSIWYFEREQSGEYHPTTVPREEAVDVTALLGIAGQLRDALVGFIANLGTAANKEVLEDVKNQKSWLQKCYDQIQEYQDGPRDPTDRLIGSRREIWKNEFELVREAVNGWKKALPFLYSLQDELDKMMPSIAEGLAMLGVPHRHGSRLAQMTLDVSRARRRTQARECRMTFRTYRKEEDPQEGYSTGLHTHHFTLQAGSVRSCRGSLSHALSHGGGVPRSLLLHASEEAGKTIAAMRDRARSMGISDLTVSVLP